jgi:hypothetical protein
MIRNVAKAQGEFSYITIERALENRAMDKEERFRYARHRPTWKQIAAVLDRAEWAEPIENGTRHRVTRYRFREVDDGQTRT